LKIYCGTLDLIHDLKAANSESEQFALDPGNHRRYVFTVGHLRAIVR
jgi:hypothetical protein